MSEVYRWRSRKEACVSAKSPSEEGEENKIYIFFIIKKFQKLQNTMTQKYKIIYAWILLIGYQDKLFDKIGKTKSRPDSFGEAIKQAIQDYAKSLPEAIE